MTFATLVLNVSCSDLLDESAMFVRLSSSKGNVFSGAKKVPGERRKKYDILDAYSRENNGTQSINDPSRKQGRIAY